MVRSSGANVLRMRFVADHEPHTMDEQSASECSRESSPVPEVTQEHRPNTVEEKKRMRNARKKRKRHARSSGKIRKKLRQDLETERRRLQESEHRQSVLRSMSRTYWERWRWELEKRKEAMVECLSARSRQGSGASRHLVAPNIHEISPTMLSDPVIDGKQQSCYLGRGSFGVVKLQLYRAIHVAVKELLPRSIRDDVVHEARMLACLCHPYLPYLFGLCTAAQPYRIVMQFHGFLDQSPVTALTMHHELERKTVGLSGLDWILVCAQLLEAMSYLHSRVHILHNDIKVDNIIVGTSTLPQQGCSAQTEFQIVLVDFGKATKVTEGRLYHLSEHEKETYRRKHPHIAPEVVTGESRQSTYSDMFSVGGVLYRICDTGCLDLLPEKKRTMLTLAEHCRHVRYHRRLTAPQALSQVQAVYSVE